MRYVAKCPWCGEPSMVDDRRLDGGAEALAHVRRCPFVPTRTTVLFGREVQS